MNIFLTENPVVEVFVGGNTGKVLSVRTNISPNVKVILVDNEKNQDGSLPFQIKPEANVERGQY